MNRHNLSFLHGISEDDKIFLSKVLDWAEAAEEKYIVKYSFFTDERMCDLCRQVLASVRYENYDFWGGYENAERRVLCVYPPYGDYGREDFPIKPVTFRYREADRLSHRDFLGAMMSLQIKRECVGDILVGSGQAVTFVRDTALSDVLSLEKIGRIGVKTSCEADLSFIPEREFQDISGTVASLRVDSVISLALRISREKSAKLIKSGLVEVNHSLCDSQKKTLVEGDKLSVRGYGKFIFKSVDGSTKKDRIHITVCKYI